MRQLLLALLMFLPQSSQKSEVQAVKGNTIVFSNGYEFETTLYELKYIGQLKAATKMPYLIMSGRGCQECDANICIYIHSPSDGAMLGDEGQTRYTHPGHELDYETDSLVYESRAFFGHVLPAVNQGVIWYEKYMTDKSSFEKSVFLVQVRGNNLVDTTYADSLPDISVTLKLAKQGECKEIAGMEQTTEP